MERTIKLALAMHAQAINKVAENDPDAGERWLFDQFGAAIRRASLTPPENSATTDQEIGQLAWRRMKPTILALLKGEAIEDIADRVKLGIWDHDVLDAATRVLSVGLGLSTEVAACALSLCLHRNLFS